jgi:hypothetical protein
MNQITDTPSTWTRYRLLIDETSELEYQIIGLLSQALIRKDGDGQPNATEHLQIQEMKKQLRPKLEELTTLKDEVAEFIQIERRANAKRFHQA